MRAILRKEFGGPEVLEIREIPEPEPKAGHAVIQVKAFGLNSAELHMRKGDWAEIADVSGMSALASQVVPRWGVPSRSEGGGPDGWARSHDQRRLRRVHPRPRYQRRPH